MYMSMYMWRGGPGATWRDIGCDMVRSSAIPCVSGTAATELRVLSAQLYSTVPSLSRCPLTLPSRHSLASRPPHLGPDHICAASDGRPQGLECIRNQVI